MCRIFGFRSILRSGVHRSLMDSDNAIIQQSDRHPDGWGVAYYQMGSPHLIKNDNQARECKIFEKVSGVVSSNTVVAHIRKSTVGPVGPLNTHPFQHGPWVFAHNGNVQNFSAVRDDLLQQVSSELRPFILGETDSELLFYFLMSLLKKRGLLVPGSVAFDFQEILDEFLSIFIKIAGVPTESQGDYDKTYLTFILTNGEMMYAFNGGQPLFYSSHKTRCPDRGNCEFFKPICENLAQKDQQIHHLLISSEVIRNENVWLPLEFGQFVGVNQKFQLINGQSRVL